jgi:hypothetical protein
MPKDSDKKAPDLIHTSNQWIRVKRLRSNKGVGTTFEAAFRFGLENLVSPQRVDAAAREELVRAKLGSITFESVLESLSSGQRIEFRFRTCRTSDSQPRLEWDIVSKTHAPTQEEAQQLAENLWENVALLLANQPDYRFRPMAEPIPQADLGYTYHFQPRSVAISTPASQIGFHGPGDEGAYDPVVLLPLLDPQPDNPFPLVLLLTSLPLDLDLCVALEPITIDDTVREDLASASRSLSSGNAMGQVWPDGKELEQETMRPQTDRWVKMLEYWLAHLEAIKVEISLSSAIPVSTSLIGSLGKALFPHYSFEPDAPGKPHKRPGPNGIPATQCQRDLRGWVHEDRAVLPAVFPDPAQLAELDLPRGYPLPPSRLPRHGLRVGAVEGQVVHLSQEDRLRHSYIVGGSGSGKSTLLLNLITQDIQAGRGVCLIDPHGDLFEEVLDRIPLERAEEVVIFNPSDFEWVTGLNFLECTSGFPEVEQSLITNEMMSIFGQLYDLQTSGGPMFELYMRNALMLVMGSPESGGTLLDVPLLFENQNYRRKLLDTCKQPLVVSFWKRQAERAGGEASIENIAPYITSKLNQFTHNVLMRRIIGQKKSTVSFRSIMDREGILLINLSKGLLSELDTRLLGMFMMGKLFHAALGRTDLPVAERKKFYVYVDEFQNFTTPTVGQILSEARKFGLCMTLANQHLAQLRSSHPRENLMDAVLGNVGNILLFRLGVLDAGLLEQFTQPWLDRQDLQYLPDFHIAARLLAEHEPIKPFVFKTDPKTPANGDGLKQLITEVSRSRDSRPALEVDRSILESIHNALVSGAGKPKILAS